MVLRAGKPACANDDMLNGILRDKWGWDGFVVSDYDAWKEIMETHHYAASYEDAGAVGLNAGLDQEGGFGTVRRVASRVDWAEEVCLRATVCKLTLSVARGQYEPVAALPSAVAAGKTTAAKVATAFTRLMRARIRLGMLGA